MTWKAVPSINKVLTTVMLCMTTSWSSYLNGGGGVTGTRMGISCQSFFGSFYVKIQAFSTFFF